MDNYTNPDTSDAQVEEARLAKLSAFAGRLAQKKKEAINGRLASGIETEWARCDDYYEGIDDMNRGESMRKPSSIEGRVEIRAMKKDDSRSTVFVNITQPYCDMGSARVADMLLPTDDKPFSFDPTPIPEVADALKDQSQMPGGQESVAQVAEAFLDDMKKRSDLAENQVWDWVVESKWHSQLRKAIEQSARLGSSCIKGPLPVKCKEKVMVKQDNEMLLVIDEKIKPASKWVDIWNIFPDPSCGDNIHKGSYLFERDFISARQLQELKGTGYLDSEIDKCLEEGPNKNNIDSKNKVIENESFEVWHYFGIANKEDMEAAGCSCDKDYHVPVAVTMVNDRVVKASVSVLDSGEFPYDVMTWQRRANYWAGIGIAAQVMTAQNMVNAATRNMMDNAGVAAGPQIIMREGAIRPSTASMEVTPLKIWYVDEDSDIQDVRQAMTSIIIPMLQVELENIIKMALDFAERATSMPMIMQGQQGANTHTVGGMNILQNNSSTVLRRIARIADDDIFEPHFSRYYEWLMLYGEDSKMKGDYKVVVHGSSALYERDAQNQMILQLLPVAVNPAYNLNPSLLMKEVLKMNKLSPERVMLTQEEIDKKAQQQPPPDPRIEGAKEVAQIKVQGDLQKAQMVNQSDMQEIETKKESMQSEMALKLQMQKSDQEHQQQLKELDFKMKMMELAQSQQVSIESIKAALADTTMRLNTQSKLSQMAQDHEKLIKAHEHASKVALQPPTEPVGKASPNHAFEQ